MALSDPDDEIDELAYRDPLPLDDRLWRHPSELAGLDDEQPTAVGKLLSFLSRPRS